MGRILKAATVAGQGRERIVSERDAILAEATATLVAARAAARAELEHAREAAVVLARTMAEKIVGHALRVDPAVMADIVGQALAASRARGGAIVLRTHPDDLAAIEQTRPQWSRRLATVEVRCIADATVERGGCIVETPIGRVDASLRSQLDALERVLRSSLPKGGP